MSNIVLPKKLVALESVVFVAFVVFLTMGLVFLLGRYREDRDKKQKGLVFLGVAAVLASMSVMGWIMDIVADQADQALSTTSLLDKLRELIKAK